MARYALSTWIVARLPADEALEELAASGFTQLELSDDEAALVRAWEADPEGTRDRLASLGMGIIAGGSATGPCTARCRDGSSMSRTRPNAKPPSRPTSGTSS
jgi:sugar phosphate isomerase/epimerase